MEVTDIKKSFHSRAKSDIYSHGEFIFSLYDSDIRKLSVSCGCELSSEKIREITETTVKKNAINDALRIIARADYPSKLIYDKLILKRYSDDISAYAVSHLTQKGYIDDYDYAEKFAVRAFSSGKKGKAYVESELLKRGIDRDIIEELCEKYYSGSDLDAIAETKFKNIVKGNNPDFKDFIKLKSYLLRQGFSFEEISDAINHIKEKTELSEKE